MTEYNLPHFGNLPLKNLQEYYNIVVQFAGDNIQMDLNFEEDSIDISKLEKVKYLIENIDKFNIKNQKYILSDYNDFDEGNTVKFYLQHHLEEFNKEELSKIIDIENSTSSLEQRLLEKLELVRIGIYPHDNKNFAIFDYSIGADFTNYLIVINTDADGNLEYMAMES